MDSVLAVRCNICYIGVSEYGPIPRECVCFTYSVGTYFVRSTCALLRTITDEVGSEKAGVVID